MYNYNKQNQPTGPLKGYKNHQNQNQNHYNNNEYPDRDRRDRDRDIDRDRDEWNEDDRGRNNPRDNQRGGREDNNQEPYSHKPHYNYVSNQGFFPNRKNQNIDEDDRRNKNNKKQDLNSNRRGNYTQFEVGYGDRHPESSRDFLNNNQIKGPHWNDGNDNIYQKRDSEESLDQPDQNDIIQISAKAEKKFNNQQMAELKKIIDLSHSYAKIEITLTQLEPTLIQQFVLAKGQFQNVSLNFQATPEPQPSESSLPKKNIMQIIPLKDQLNEQRIYQFQEQIENQVPQNMKLIIFHWKIMPQFISDSQRCNLQIQVNSVDSQYKVDGNDLNMATQFFKKMKTDLDFSVIVLQECKSDIEARSISNILQKGQIYNNLQNALCSQEVIVDSTTQLNLNDFKNASSLNDQVLYLKKRQATVFAIIQNLKQIQIKTLQENFTQFIQHPKQIKLLKDQSQFQLSQQPDLNAINKEISKLNFQGFEIYISEPNMDYRISKYVIEVSYTLWYPGDLSESNGKQMMTQIKNSIYCIFNPIISIILDDQEQKEIWQDYLNSYFEKNKDKIQIKTVKNPQTNDIEIKLTGDVDKCRSMKAQIIEELKSINSQELEIKYKGNKSVLSILGEQSFQDQIFRKQLDQIQNQHKNLRIRVNKILKKTSVIQFKIQFKDNLTLEQIKEILLRELILKIESFSEKIDFRKLLKYLELDDETFEETYGMIVSDSKDSIIFVSTQQYIEEVKDLIKQFNSVLEQQNKIQTLKFDSNLLFQKLQEMIISKKLELLDYVKCNFIGTAIQLVGPIESVGVVQQLISGTEQQLKSQLLIRKLDLNEKEVSFFTKNLKQKMESSLQKYDCEINTNSQHMSSQNCIATTLSYQDRELSVVYADISKFECDAIVNSCNNLMSFGDVDMLSGVARKIFDMAGADYTNFCEKYILKHQTLRFGEAITYKMQNSSTLKYIINVSTPIYKDGQQTNQDFQIIEQNINAIFIEANKRNIKKLALPIFGGGACGYSFQQISQNVLNSIINMLYSPKNQIVQTVYVTESSESKLKQISQILKQILQPPQQIRQIKYQWQWEEQNQFKDYDDEDINRQIDEGFEQFTNQRQTHEVKLVFPFTKQPGTHIVNLKTMIIKDIALQSTIQLSLQTVNGNKRFLFDNQQIEDVLNEYLMLQQLNKNYEFQIFYKRHKIIFNSDGTIQQLNEATGFSRQVKHISYQQNQQQKNQNILTGKNVNLLQKTYDKFLNQQYEIVVKSFDIQVINDLQKLIKEEILKNTIDLKISLPRIKEEDFNDLKAFIIQNSIKSYGDIQNGQNLTLQIFKKKKSKIQAQIDMVISNTKKYPINWVQQDKNSIKVDLSPNSQEYKEIQDEFLKTCAGKIYKISRLQNQRLWENYQLEQKNLQDLSLKRNTPLTQLEQERYLWHGVRGQHPKLIYESMKEAFDMTYSNQGMWGTGIYFAERADYSKNYSYTLTQQDDLQLANKLVFLCCKVATGKIHTCNPDNTLKRPPQGFDCVSGFTNGSTVFVLYGMDVRRAYPAYEVIYK